MFIDYQHRKTYVYATTASGLLPALGGGGPAGVAQAAHPHFAGVTERIYNWPGGKDTV